MAVMRVSFIVLSVIIVLFILVVSWLSQKSDKF